MLYPIQFYPIYVDKIWGGTRLSSIYKRELPTTTIGESWEASVQKGAVSVAANGEKSGSSLVNLAAQWGERLLGRRCKGTEFPLLVKLIDAQDVLSVQVHPDHNAAAHLGGASKTEMWLVLHANPNACLYSGLKQGTDEERLRAAINEGACEKLLNRITVTAGDVLFIPAGTVHAIGAGLLLYELQESSDTTFRLYDWNRLDSDGKMRALHIEESLKSIHYHLPVLLGRGVDVADAFSRRSILASCSYFTLERIETVNEWEDCADGMSFHILTVLTGTMEIRCNGFKQSFIVQMGSSVLIPAALGSYSVNAGVVYLKAYIADQQKDIVQPLLDSGYDVEQIKQKVLGMDVV